MAIRRVVDLLLLDQVDRSSFDSSSSSKLTKMWSNVKQQREDDFVFGGERSGIQVLSNSFIPTLLCVYVVYARSGLRSELYGRIPYQESRDDVCV